MFGYLLSEKNAVFTAATMLLLNKWSTDRGLHNPTDDLALVYTSIDILKTQQERYAGFTRKLNYLV